MSNDLSGGNGRPDGNGPPGENDSPGRDNSSGENNPPGRNNPLGPYYPSELPAVPGSVSKRTVLLLLGFWFLLTLVGFVLHWL